MKSLKKTLKIHIFGRLIAILDAFGMHLQMTSLNSKNPSFCKTVKSHVMMVDLSFWKRSSLHSSYGSSLPTISQESALPVASCAMTILPHPRLGSARRYAAGHQPPQWPLATTTPRRWPAASRIKGSNGQSWRGFTKHVKKWPGSSLFSLSLNQKNNLNWMNMRVEWLQKKYNMSVSDVSRYL